MTDEITIIQSESFVHDSAADLSRAEKDVFEAEENLRTANAKLLKAATNHSKWKTRLKDELK